MRLLIADDRPRTRRALRSLLATAPGLEVVGEAADGADTIAKVDQVHPDVVLLDVCMPRLDGIAAAARIKCRWPFIRVVAHSISPDRSAEALAAGSDAFVLKGAPCSQLLEALQPSAGASPQRS